jgi:hypothetical protein
MATTVSKNPDALPQLIGEFKPVDEWQAHVSRIFYGLRAGRVRDYYQTFATADYRLAHALAADYYARVIRRDRAIGNRQWAMGKAPSEDPPHSPVPIAHSLIVHEWGCGNGNLAACFLSHLQRLDKDGLVYPRVRYVLVDNQEEVLEAARACPDLAPHEAHVEVLCAGAEDLGTVEDGTVDRIFANELWSDMPAKLLLRKGSDIEEEYLRPNLNPSTLLRTGESKPAVSLAEPHEAITDWSGFVRAFDAKDTQALKGFPSFLEDIVWEKEYRKADWKTVPYRKTVSEFLKQIDEEVLVPVNLGAFATIKEARRVLAPDAIGFSSLDAGTADLTVLNDPAKPCYGQFGGQYSFMVNFALVEAVAKHLGVSSVVIEPQREYLGRSLGLNLLSLMDLLASYPTAGILQPWEQDRLIIKTIRVLNEAYQSPYERRIEFPVRQDMPPEEREALQETLLSLKRDGVPDTIAYLSEEEIFMVIHELEGLGYDQDLLKAALRAHPQSVDYYHLFFRP